MVIPHVWQWAAQVCIRHFQKAVISNGRFDYGCHCGGVAADTETRFLSSSPSTCSRHRCCLSSVCCGAFSEAATLMGSDRMIDECSPEEISHRHFIFLCAFWEAQSQESLHFVGEKRNKKEKRGDLNRCLLPARWMICGRSTIKICNRSNIIYLY